MTSFEYKEILDALKEKTKDVPDTEEKYRECEIKLGKYIFSELGLKFDMNKTPDNTLNDIRNKASEIADAYIEEVASRMMSADMFVEDKELTEEMSDASFEDDEYEMEIG